MEDIAARRRKYVRRCDLDIMEGVARITFDTTAWQYIMNALDLFHASEDDYLDADTGDNIFSCVWNIWKELEYQEVEPCAKPLS